MALIVVEICEDCAVIHRLVAIPLEG
jgi:hypothetical protein